MKATRFFVLLALAAAVSNCSAQDESDMEDSTGDPILDVIEELV